MVIEEYLDHKPMCLRGIRTPAGIWLFEWQGKYNS